MTILDDLIASLDAQTAVRDVRVGPFQTAVLSRHCGLASTQVEGRQHGRYPVAAAGDFIGTGALEVVRLAYSPNPVEATIGMATLNSLLEVDGAHGEARNGYDLMVERGAGKRVALVGHFPFVPQLRQAVKELWVIERQPREGDLTEAEGEELIPQADVVAITGTAFINHTIEHVLSLCSPAAYVIILGGTTPLSTVLFDHGVDALSGTQVVDADLALRCVSQGATFRQLRGVRLLTLRKQ
ncbi:MAG: DUF364 domain-containing protein [Chloroflexi bacterium]|nr:DUF364 domain-containing protein [Chloroflexota bacterium]